MVGLILKATRQSGSGRPQRGDAHMEWALLGDWSQHFISLSMLWSERLCRRSCCLLSGAPFIFPLPDPIPSRFVCLGESEVVLKQHSPPTSPHLHLQRRCTAAAFWPCIIEHAAARPAETHAGSRARDRDQSRRTDRV